jgi:pyruvyltransferase
MATPVYYCIFYKPNVEKEHELGIIPHYVDYERTKKENKDKKILIINILDGIEKVMDDINRCKRIISSSLHGIIASHAYGIPSIWVKFSDKLAGDNIKFADYFLSVKINPYDPLDFRNKELSIKEIIRMIDSIKYKPHIDTAKLLEVCPFKKR